MKPTVAQPRAKSLRQRRASSKRIDWRRALRNPELLEARRVMAVTVTVPVSGTWEAIGPSPSTGSQVLIGVNQPITGAVRAIGVQADIPATALNESKIVYIGSVNGGVWRTTDIDANPVVWTPLTDDMPSSAIGAIAISPKDQSIVYAGTGKFSSFGAIGTEPLGLYKTVNGNKTDGKPTWSHLEKMHFLGQTAANDTNIFKGLPITSIALSPLDANVILVGTSGFAIDGNTAGISRGGLYRSEDGGTTWLNLSTTINAPDGLNNNNSADGRIDEPGEINQNDNVDNDLDGTVDELLEVNFPGGTVFDLAWVPGTSTVFATGDNPYVLRSDDSGKTWKRVSQNFPSQPAAGSDGSTNENVRIAVNSKLDAALNRTTVIYAGIVIDGVLSQLMRSSDLGDTWTKLVLPPQIHNVKQGGKHFSIAVDPNDPNLIFLGGDSQPTSTENGCTSFVGRLYRGTVSTSASPNVNWDPLFCNSNSGTAPHADSRDMEFLPNHPDQMLQADDGGIYVLTNSSAANNAGSSSARKWESRIGNLQLGEVTDITYIPKFSLVAASLQDNGVATQISSTGEASKVWANIQKGDGFGVAVDPHHPDVLYAAGNNLASFDNYTYLSSNAFSVDDGPTKDLSTADEAFIKAKSADTVPFAFNPDEADQLILGYRNLYESHNGGDSVTSIQAMPTSGNGQGPVSAVAVAGSGNAQVIYSARSKNITVFHPDAAGTGRTIGPSITKGTEFACGETKYEPYPINDVGFTLPSKRAVVDLTINPNNFNDAFAVTGDNFLYRTTNGGGCWSVIPVSSSVRSVGSVEIIDPRDDVVGDEILVVGTDQGVWRAFTNDSGELVNLSGLTPNKMEFQQFGKGLPTALITSMHYDAGKDLLLVGTLGRGAWKLKQSVSSLTPVIVNVNGTSGKDDLLIKKIIDAAGDPQVEVSQSGTKLGQFSIEAVDRIRIFGNGDSDTITIDNTTGYFATFGTKTKGLTIEYVGGETTGDSDKLIINNTGVAGEMISAAITPTGAETGKVVLASNKSLRPITILYSQLENTPTTNIPITINTAGIGLKSTAKAIAEASNLNMGGFLGFGTNLSEAKAPAAKKKVNNKVSPNSTPAELAAFIDTPNSGSPMLERILEQSLNGFSLDEIGNAISTPAQLELLLENLDTVPNNVSLTQSVDANGNPVARFDVQIETTLFAQVPFDATLASGLVSLESTVEAFADVQSHFVFGFDGQGFFIDPEPLDATGSPIGPEFRIHNIRGKFAGVGRVGIVDVKIENGVFATDRDVGFTIDLLTPTTLPPVDGLLRNLDLLDRPLSELVAIDEVADPNDAVDDLTLTADYKIMFGQSAALPAFGLRLSFPNASDLSSGVALPKVGETVAPILDFVNSNIDQIISGIRTLSAAVEDATGVSALDKKIPLLNKTLGEVLSSTPTPLVIAAADITHISAVQTDALGSHFTLSLANLNVATSGIEVDNLVEFTSAAGAATVSATVTRITHESLEITLPAGSVAAPAQNSAFKIQRVGNLQSQLRSLVNGITFSIPTIQEMVEELERITGLEILSKVRFVGTPGTTNFAVEFPISFDPDSRLFKLPIDLSTKASGLSMDANATAEVSVDAKFDITIGVNLAKNNSDGSAVAPADRVYLVATKDKTPPAAGQPQPTNLPLVTLNTTVRLNNPDIQGSVGFLDVRLQENRAPGSPIDDPETPEDEDGNEGIEASLTARFDMVDADSDTNNQRIAIPDLFTNALNVFDFGLDGMIDIDGLKVVAGVGDAINLGQANISLDGESGSAAPGHVESFADLANVFQQIQVSQNFTDMSKFQNIGVTEILAALELLVDQLRDMGHGGIFDKPIPIVNRSVSELIDLGQEFDTAISQPGSQVSIASIAKLEQYLNSRLGSPAQPDVVNVIVDGQSVRFAFAFSRGVQRDLPISFSTNAGGLSITGDADINLTACANFSLTLGILTQPGLSLGDRFFIDTTADASRLSVQLLANSGYSVTQACAGLPLVSGSPIDLDAVVGPLGLHIENGRVLADLQLAGNLTTTASDKRIRLNNLNGTSIQPTFSGAVQAIVPLDGNNDGIVSSLPAGLGPSDALVKLGGKFTSASGFAFDPQANPGTSLLVIPNSADPAVPIASQNLPNGSLRVETYKLDQLISGNFLNFGTMIEGLEKFLEWSDKVLGRDFLDREIPFLGKSVRDGLNFLESDKPGAKTFRTVIQAILAGRTDAGVDSLGANASNIAVERAIGIIRNALVALPGISPSGNFNGDSVTNNLDIGVPVKNGDEVTGAIFRFRFNPAFTTSRPLDLGLDFLNLQANGDVTLSGNLNLNLGFGITKQDGFFFITNLPGPEFSIGGSIAPTGSLNAKLGFLDVTGTINAGSNMSAAFTMDIVDPSGDGKLTLGELTQNALVTLVPDANIHLDVEAHLDATLSTAIVAHPELPKLSAQLDFDWGIVDSTQADGYRPFDLIHLGGSLAPSVIIKNITLDLGSFLTTVVQPIFSKIQESGLVPSQLKNALDTKLPIIDRKVKDLLHDLVATNPQKLRAFELLLDTGLLLTNTVSNVQLATDDSLKINFGSVSVGASASDSSEPVVTPVAGQSTATVLRTSAAPASLNESAQDVPGSKIPLIGDFFTKLGEIGITFPALRISNLAGLIVGKDIDLVFIDVPELKITKDFDVSFPLLGGGLGDIVSFSINAFLSGGFELVAHISGGFDTSGIRQGNFLNGFYLGDFDPNSGTPSLDGQIDSTDVERPEVQFTAFVQAGVAGEAEIIGFDIGRIEGYIKVAADINIDLNDDNEKDGAAPACDTRTYEQRHDGRLHFNEINPIKQSHGGQLLSILELGGDLYAEFGVHITVLGGLLYDKNFYKRFDLLSFDNLQFPVSCVGSGGGGGNGSCSAGDGGIGTVQPVGGGLFEININPSDAAQSSPSGILATFEDLDGNPFNGGGFSTFDPDQFTTQFGADTFTISGNASFDTEGQGLAVGQGVTLADAGGMLGGVITEVTPHGFKAQRFRGALPALTVGASGESIPLTIYEPGESIVLSQGGSQQIIGPNACGGNVIPGSTSVASVNTDDNPQGLGDGNNTFQTTTKFRTPVRIDGGKGNDTIIVSSPLATLRGGDGDDTLQVQFSTHDHRASLLGDKGNDKLVGGRGVDTLLGGDGNDQLLDNGFLNDRQLDLANDLAVGGGGKDVLISRGGDDILVGDYDSLQDPQPEKPADQFEDSDYIKHGSVGRATMFGDNKGLGDTQAGAPPKADRPQDDRVQTSSLDALVVADTKDVLTGVGTTVIESLIKDPVISANTVSGLGFEVMRIEDGARVLLANTQGNLTINASEVGSTVTLSQSINGLRVQFSSGSVAGSMIELAGITQITFKSSSGVDRLVIDASGGNPIPLDGIAFIGQSALRGLGDSIAYIGSGVESVTAGFLSRAESSGFEINGRAIKASGLRSMEMSRLAAFSVTTRPGIDAYQFRPAVNSAQIPSLEIVGSSQAVTSTRVLLTDVTSVAFDTGAGESTIANDNLTISSGALAARSLASFLLSTGAGVDTVRVDATDLRLGNGPSWTLDAGTGVDQLIVTGDANYNLNGDLATLSSSGGGSVALRNLGSDAVQLTGGNSINSFAVTNWPGTVTINGAAGTDNLTYSARGGTLNAVDELTLSTSITVNSAATTAVLRGPFLIGKTNLALNVADGAAAVDLLIDGTVQGAFGITKSGTGTLELSQRGIYTGITTISAGVVLVDAGLSGPVVLNGGVLRGNGTVGAVSGTSGSISPGAVTGSLAVTGNLALTARLGYQADIQSTTAGATNKGYDVLVVNGTLNLANAPLLVNVGFSSIVGSTYRIIDNDGTDAIVGTFAGLAESSTLTANGFVFRISYRGGSGNDVILTHISNSAPAFVNRSLTPAVDEFGVVTVAGSITEPDVGDLFTLIVDWHDGVVEQFEFDPSQSLAVQVTHRFNDDHYAATTEEGHPIDLTWRDQHGASNSTTMFTRINNVAPAVKVVWEAKDLVNTTFVAKGTFVDPGTDSWSATVNYGDGSSIQALALASDGSFQLNHTYATEGSFEVVVEITDDDGGQGTATLPIKITSGSDSNLRFQWWQNIDSPLDVNNDGQITPLDALLVINSLNQRGAIRLAELPYRVDIDNPPLLDVSNDFVSSALDALLIINFLNQQVAEGESSWEQEVQEDSLDWLALDHLRSDVSPRRRLKRP